jgi:hypothetical protein
MDTQDSQDSPKKYDPSIDIWSQVSCYGGGSDVKGYCKMYSSFYFKGVQYSIDEYCKDINFINDESVPPNGIKKLHQVYHLGKFTNTPYVELYTYVAFIYEENEDKNGATILAKPENFQKVFNETILGI